VHIDEKIVFYIALSQDNSNDKHRFYSLRSLQYYRAGKKRQLTTSVVTEIGPRTPWKHREGAEGGMS
jgi:hypothetical protein